MRTLLHLQVRLSARRLTAEISSARVVVTCSNGFYGYPEESSSLLIIHILGRTFRRSPTRPRYSFCAQHLLNHETSCCVRWNSWMRCESAMSARQETDGRHAVQARLWTGIGTTATNTSSQHLDGRPMIQTRSSRCIRRMAQRSKSGMVLCEQH